MVNLKIPPEKAIRRINERIDDLKTLRANQHGIEYYDFIGWCSKTWAVIDEIYETDDMHPEEIRILGMPTCSCNFESQAQMLVEVYRSKLLEYISEIRIFMQTRV